MSATTHLDQDATNLAHEHLSKARAIVETTSTALNAELGFEGGRPYCNALWAASDCLDALAKMLGLDPSEAEAQP